MQKSYFSILVNFFFCFSKVLSFRRIASTDYKVNIVVSPKLFSSSKTAVLAETLLNQAVTLVSNHISKNDEQNSSRKSLPNIINFSFSSRYKRKIFLNGTETANLYLSQPASNYSLLNTTMIKKSLNSSECFDISIPLKDVASALEAISPGRSNSSQYRALRNYILQSQINVVVDPTKGEIDMKSSNFYFRPKTSHLFVNTSTKEAAEGAYNVVRDMLPGWLIWANNSDIVDHSKDSTVSDPILNEPNKLIPTSLQPAIIIQMRWNPEYNKSRDNSMPVLLHKLVTAKSSKLDQLELDIISYVSFTVSLRTKSRLSSALSLLPVKVLINKAGSLILSMSLNTIAGRLIELLVLDFESRFKSVGLV